jgi:hypothetical protein
MSDSSDELAPSKIMETYVAEQSVLDSFARRLMVKIKARLGVGLSHRRRGPRKRILRDHAGAHQRLVEDYFAEQPLYPDSMFRTRFRMNRDLFVRIVNALGQWSPYFTYRADCSGRIGLSPLQKCTAAMRMLAYGTPADALDEYLKIGKSTALECLDKFARGVIQVFGGTTCDAPHRRMSSVYFRLTSLVGSLEC